MLSDINKQRNVFYGQTNLIVKDKQHIAFLDIHLLFPNNRFWIATSFWFSAEGSIDHFEIHLAV